MQLDPRPHPIGTGVEIVWAVVRGVALERRLLGLCDEDQQENGEEEASDSGERGGDLWP